MNAFLHQMWVAALILWPADVAVRPQQSAETWNALKTIARAHEIVGPHEHWAQDFNSELSYVRHNYWCLRDAPLIGDALRLPSRAVAKDRAEFSEKFHQWLVVQIELRPHANEDLDALRSDVCRRQTVWVLVLAAQNESNAWAYRRRRLASLREMIGE